MSREEYTEGIFWAGAQIGRRMHNVMRVYVRAYGLNATDISVLRLLQDGETDTAKAIVEKTGFSRSLVSKTVESLLTAGHIEATQDAQDRRIMRLRLKKDGAVLREKMNFSRQKFEKELWDGVSQTEQETALRVLQKLCENLDAIVGSWEKSEETE